MTLQKSLTTMIGSVAALAMLPAMAGSISNANAKSLEVSIAGYDLSDPAHAQIVYYKIQKAAKRVCRHTLARETLRERMDQRQCQETAIQDAVTQLNAPELTLVMLERTQRS
ncbi:MAG: UrcA family protein [Pseudomonadota bacterium]